ncbi:PorT family protein [Nonlabens sp. Ci31]|jgi:hypothetical protein|uniref:outer membrane beta-barrel protein n=1 Tax=Nonlabens sp. Ci31 TaxID=2608253 RepID=UPI0014632EF7|nr:outer membrane beta-barrel protein [Nonlabens sp. Ci31]QJP34946.1 PorT family protein [Nonlabens sp. Ci31]
MKTTILSIALLAFTALSFAQNDSGLSPAKLNVGLTLGTYSFNSDTQDVEIEYSFSAGFRIGVDFSVYEDEQFDVETGITLTNHRSLVDQPEIGAKINYDIYWAGSHAILNYHILPQSLSVGAGIFADFGIAGTQQFEGSDKVNVFDEIDGGDAPLSRLNYGAAFKLNHIMSWTDFADDLYISYRLGLADIEGADNDTQSFKTGMISIGVRSTFENLF